MFRPFKAVFDLSRRGKTFSRYITSKAKQKEAMLDAAYSVEEKANILDCFNKCSETELTYTKHLNKQKAVAVVNHRTKHGLFETVSSLLRVPGIGALGLQKLCDSLKDKDYLTLQKLKQAEVVEAMKSYPSLSEKQCSDIESVISLEVQADRVSWIKMNRDLEVEAWSQYVLFDRPYFRFDHVVYLNQIHEFVSSLPSCSIYSMENKQYRVPSIKIMPFIVSLKCLETMLVTVLNKDFDKTQQQKVYLIKPTVISRYFNLLVGGERVSGQHVTRDILLQQSEFGNDVLIPESLTTSYFRYDSIQQEKLSSCLLQSIAFVKLIVLKKR